ncbi:hypothetical protein C0995_016126 [Termitomyces sp. Mi166|nr:hypothetical protein C0995_016126 [Termitomyces sp. Mi166\
MNIAKRAKRIGLLFSEAQLDWQLDPKYIADILDIKSGDEIFSDGCGLMSKRFAVQVSKAKKIIFRSVRYTPSVFQIRYEILLLCLSVRGLIDLSYLGYKGVLMLHPDLDKEKRYLVQFRKSMKKFSTTKDITFSLVNYSKPYTFGRLNNDVIVLLSSLGISNEKLRSKQQEYFEWIRQASIDRSLGDYELAEKVLLNGLDDPDVSKKVRKRQVDETAKFKNEKGRSKAPIFVRNSRRLFGVCDPYQVLKEGQVHIRIMTGRAGPSTPIHGDVIVVRNPCLHPGDCLKLRAVHHEKLAHLVDCVVFATVARPGHHSAPSMSSGGDLDGDEYFVFWDKDIIPTTVVQSYDYPGNKEHTSKMISRADLARHFVFYSGAGVARVSSLHAKWVRASPLGALSPECQELNALYSQSVDGAQVRIPDRLTNPPERTDIEPYILDVLEADRKAFADEFLPAENMPLRDTVTMMDSDGARDLLVALLSKPTKCRIRRLYSSKTQGLTTFFEFLRMGTQEYTRKLRELNNQQTEERFAIGIFMRGDMIWGEDPDVNENVVVCAFMPNSDQALSGYKPCTTGYRLHMSDSHFQNHVGDTFIFINRRPLGSGFEVATSIALQKISAFVQRQIGRIRTTPVVAVEIHVVSNRDRIAHQLFDLWFEQFDQQLINTQVFQRSKSFRGSNGRQPLIRINNLRDVDWKLPENRPFLSSFYPKEESTFPRIDIPEEEDDVFGPLPGSIPQEPNYERHTLQSMHAHLSTKTAEEIDRIMDFASHNHADEMFLIFDFVIAQQPLKRDTLERWIERFPPLAFTLLKRFVPQEDSSLPGSIVGMTHLICRNIIRCANSLGIAALVAIEKMAKSIADMDVEQYLDLSNLASHCVRSRHLFQEVLLSLNDSRLKRCK